MDVHIIITLLSYYQWNRVGKKCEQRKFDVRRGPTQAPLLLRRPKINGMSKIAHRGGMQTLSRESRGRPCWRSFVVLFRILGKINRYPWKLR